QGEKSYTICCADCAHGPYMLTTGAESYKIERWSKVCLGGDDPALRVFNRPSWAGFLLERKGKIPMKSKANEQRRQRQHVVAFRVSDAEHARIEATAAAEMMSVSTWLRRVAVRAAQASSGGVV